MLFKADIRNPLSCLTRLKNRMYIAKMQYLHKNFVLHIVTIFFVPKWILRLFGLLTDFAGAQLLFHIRQNRILSVKLRSVHPDHILLALKPGDLTLRKMAGVAF